MDQGFAELHADIKELRRDIENPKLRMQEFAYRFEVRDLEKRLERVEAKLKLSAR